MFKPVKKKTLIFSGGKLDKKATKKFNKKPYMSIGEAWERQARARKDARLARFW